MTIESYNFYDLHEDRARLMAQSRIFSTFVKEHAVAFVGPDIHGILDLGCGEGQIGLALRSLYPKSRLVGLDQDAETIAKAQKMQTTLRNVEFVVGDMQKGLPPGPFDLVYASLSLSHLRNPQAMIPLIWEALSPGGYLWIKDLGPDMEHAGMHPTYQKLVHLTFSALGVLGAHMQVIAELRPQLLAAGFQPVLEVPEVYPLGGHSAAGRAILTNMLSVIYAARLATAKVHQMTEGDIKSLCFAVSTDALNTEGELGTCPFNNLIVRKPV